MKYSAHISEEKIVDFVLEKVDDIEQQRIWKHVKQCNTCNSLWREWNNTLLANTVSAPSSKLKQRINQSINDIEERMHIKRRWKWKPVIGSFVSAAVIFLCFLLYNEMRSNDLTYEVMQHEDIHQHDIVDRPNTNHLTIIPVATYPDITGQVWIDNSTNELLMEADGLSQLSNNDYQLWFVSDDEDEAVYSELLYVKNEAVSLYYRGDNLGTVNFMKVSIEPAGGSEKPTGPDTFFVNFKK